MRAAKYERYGPPDVLTVVEVPRPTLGEHDVLVQVVASPVTQGDRRLRAADFPGVARVLGRLMFGVFAPRHPVPGSMFAGRVVEVGSAVTALAVGDDVFGATMHGAHAEYLAMPEDGAVARMPDGLAHAEAAVLPYGAGTALTFLRDMAKVQPGERVLVIGAGGGVGRYAVQLARHLGAIVTGVAGGDEELVRELGAHEVIDYRSEDFGERGSRWDVIFDTSGKVDFGRSRGSLTESGRYLSLYLTVPLLWQMALSAAGRRPRAIGGVAMDSRAHLEQLRALVADGALRPVIARRFPLDQIAAAHAALEQGHLRGDLVIDVA